MNKIEQHQQLLRQCSQCSNMIGPVIMGNPVQSCVMSVGQAPGIREGVLQRPFAWTAGKTLFKWFEQIGVNEEAYRKHIYMAAVCRCFPGKKPKGGDRVPAVDEVENCSQWLQMEYELLQPTLILPIGKLAIQQYLRCSKLTEVVGLIHSVIVDGRTVDIIPLPHPSGLSTWFRTEPEKTLLQQALTLIQHHPEWKKVLLK